MATTRDRIIATTCALLEEQGYHATGLNQIITQSDAPRGSLYYYFPDGKDGLTAEAIEQTGRLVAERIRTGLAWHADAAEAVRAFVAFIADQVEASGFRAGGPLTTVAMETAATNERLNLVCRDAFARLQAAFAEKLVASGYAEGRAAELATFITASVEGAIILSRTRHTGDPLRRVAVELGRMLTAERPA